MQKMFLENDYVKNNNVKEEFESSRLNKEDVESERELFEELGINNLDNLEKIDINTEDYNKLIEEKDNRIKFLENRITDFYKQLNL